MVKLAFPSMRRRGHVPEDEPAAQRNPKGNKAVAKKKKGKSKHRSASRKAKKYKNKNKYKYKIQKKKASLQEASPYLEAVLQHEDVQQSLVREVDASTPGNSSAGKAYESLVSLYEAKAMNETQFELRKAQLINTRTNTAFSSTWSETLSDSDSDSDTPTTTRTSSASLSVASGSSVPEEARLTVQLPSLPEFRGGAHRAREIRFDPSTGAWMQVQSFVEIEYTPFAAGAMRRAFRMKHPWTATGKWYVAKQYYDPVSGAGNTRPPSSYFADVHMQSEAMKWAQAFNARGVPKMVSFLPAFVVQLLDMPGMMYACEPFVAGSYKKHNNNDGWVADDVRATPQAFSHFTWEASSNELIVVDIQGVNDYWTDPQIHAIYKDFGVGNQRWKGIQKFFSTHKCNAVCRALGLPLRGACLPMPAESGTQPRPALPGLEPSFPAQPSPYPGYTP